jgi:hypothetical protein
VKTWFPAIVALAIGLASGRGAVPTRLSIESAGGILLAPNQAGPDASTSAMANSDRSGPRVALDQEQHDFGKSDVGDTGRHTFIFTNIGDKPLVLSRGRSTCGCCTCVCTLRLPAGAVAPGHTAKVILEWKSKLYVGPFRQTATILTNDASRPEVTLSISGRFAGPVGVVPSQLVFTSMRYGQAAVSEVHVYSYLEESLEIAGYDVSNQQISKYFDVAWQRMSAEQLREEKEARGGYAMRVTVKPGLPVGAFRQGITLKTNSKSVPRIDIPVQGSIVNDISIAGRGWNAQTEVLTMGTVRSREGSQWSLLIVARGPHAKDLRLKPVHIVPRVLDVKLGSTRYISETQLSLTRLMIHIPPGSEPTTHLGAEQGEPGRITIQTNHPQLREVNIQVRFAVSE